jgi:hypothetical protein
MKDLSQGEPAPNEIPSSSQADEEGPNADVVDAFGSLSICSGREKHYGQTTASWATLLVRSSISVDAAEADASI